MFKQITIKVLTGYFEIWTLFHVRCLTLRLGLHCDVELLWRVAVTQDEDVATGVCCGVGGVRVLRVCGTRFSQSRRHRSKVGQFNFTSSGSQRVQMSYMMTGTKCSIAFNNYCLSNRKFERLADPLDEIVTISVHKYNVIMSRPNMTWWRHLIRETGCFISSIQLNPFRKKTQEWLSLKNLYTCGSGGGGLLFPVNMLKYCTDDNFLHRIWVFFIFFFAAGRGWDDGTVMTGFWEYNKIKAHSHQATPTQMLLWRAKRVCNPFCLSQYPSKDQTCRLSMLRWQWRRHLVWTIL